MFHLFRFGWGKFIHSEIIEKFEERYNNIIGIIDILSRHRICLSRVYNWVREISSILSIILQ